MILFRKIRYRVTLRTKLEFCGPLQRKIWRRCAPRVEWRENKSLHVFLDDGVDPIGQRWKSQCGRFHHEGLMGVKLGDVKAEIEEYLNHPIGKCTTCWAWLRKNKDSVIAAERLNG